MIISKLRNMTIRHKLTAIIMLTSVVSLLLALIAFITWEYLNAKKNMIASWSTYAAVIADNSKAAVAFKDEVDARQILSALRAENSTIFACLYNKQGQVLAEYQRVDISEDIQPPKLQKDGYAFKNGRLSMFRHIDLDDETIGTIYLLTDLSKIYKNLAGDLTIGIIVIMGVLFAAYLSSSQLQKIISGPILNLAEVAKTVSEKRDYSIRAVKDSNDEVGLLTTTFNEMLEQIQQRDLALSNTNEQLEIRVKERTAELMVTNEQLTGEITERKRAEKALEELNRDLESTVQKLHLVNQRLQDFFHMAAHDLKSPLRAIGTLAAWLSTDYADKFDQSGQEKVKLIVDRAERMSKLIDGILQYSAITRANEREEPVNLNAVFSEVIRDIHAPESIEIITENEMPRIVCERAHIMRVFQSLLGNSVKYMDKPKGQIKIGCVEENGFWKFSVADNGRGIEEKYFEKIFKIYQKLFSGSNSETGGIALAIVKKIVEMYGGKIWVQSKAGCGSTFFFTLPK